MSNKLHHRNLPVPFFSQREVRYIWEGLHPRDIIDPSTGRIRNRAGEPIGRPIPLASRSCNIVSLCMLLHYYGITDDTPDTMLRKFYEVFREGQFSREATVGYPYFTGANRPQVWSNLQEFAEGVYNLPNGYIRRGNLNIRYIKTRIANGHPVMFSYGVVPFTNRRLSDGTFETNFQSGHIAVCRGFTEKNHIIINDPWGDVATPDGFLVTLFPNTPDTSTSPDEATTSRGRFLFGQLHASENVNVRRHFSGLGNGDNAVLRLEEFKKLIPSRSLHTPLHATMYIEYPHIWSFPYRQTIQDDAGRNIERRFVFSNHDINEPINREDQVNAMLATEVIEDAGYPIRANRFWHSGIHIRGRENTPIPVYAVGPGRLVAARIQAEANMPSTGSSNFVLVRHQVKRDNKIREFYSHYMHLAPVDIAERIRAGIAADDSEQREKDWIGQLIEKIRPKKALITAVVNSLDSELNPVGTLPFSSIIYLCPRPHDNNQNNCVRHHMENINPNEELELNRMNWFYSAVDNVRNYIHTIGNTEYYAYYHRPRETGNIITWELRYIRVNSAVIPQIVNMPQFVYYRRLLAKLLSGKAVTFAKEDIKKAYKGEEEDSRYFFRNNMVEIFMRIESIDSVGGIKIREPLKTVINKTNLK